MSIDSSVPEGTEAVKTNILEMLNVPVLTEAVPTKVDSVDADAARKEIVDRFDKANARLAAAARELARLSPSPDFELESKSGQASHEVSRYFPGLFGTGTLTGKDAKRFEAARSKAIANLVKLEAFAIEAETKANSKFEGALTSANKEIEDFKTQKNDEIKELDEQWDEKKSERGKLRVKSFKDTVENISTNTRSFYEGKVKELTTLKNSKKGLNVEQTKQLAIAESNIRTVGQFETLTQEIEDAKQMKDEAEEKLKLDLKAKLGELEELKRNQVIEWSNPKAIVYGTALDSTQLNAKLTCGDGILQYSGAKGETLEGRFLDAGDGQILRVVAKGTDKFKTSAPKEVTIDVKKADQAITWNEPGEITYGTKLSATQLSATVTTDPPMPDKYAAMAKKLKYFEAGTEVAIDSVLDAGDHTLTAKMAVENANFNPAAEKSVKIKVNQAKREIAWPNPIPAEITYGTKLSTTQLSATVTTDPPLTNLYVELTKVLKYVDAEGKEVKVGAILDVGDHTLTVKTVENKNFAAATDKSATFKIAPAEREIGSSKLKPIECVVTAADMNQLKAKVKFIKGGGELEYFVNGVKLAVDTVLKAGDGQPLRAVATPSTNYKETPPLEVDIDVTKQNPVITWKEPKPLVAPATLTKTQLNAVRVKGDQALAYNLKENDVLNVGTFFLTATHAESEKFERGTKTVRLMVYANAAQGKGFEDMRSGSAWDTTTLSTDEIALLSDWNNDKNGMKAKAKELMGSLKEMSGPELKAYMNSLVTDPSKMVDETVTNPSKACPNLLWALPDGMQVRYKPNGDVFCPDPMFCIEARTSPACSQNSSDVAFKVTVDGVAASKGPAQNKATTLPHYEVQSYNSGTCGATHLMCAPKVDQPIEWRIPKDLRYGAIVSEDWAKLPRDGGARTFDPPAGTELNPGDGQDLKITTAETDKYKLTTVETTIDVNQAKQVIAWENPAEITYPTPLSAEQLKATVTTDPESAAGIVAGTLDTLQKALEYVNDKGEKLDGMILDAGEGQNLKVVAPGTMYFEANEKIVTINVKQAEQVIAWANPNPAEITESTPLSKVQLNATVTTNPPMPSEYAELSKSIKYFDEEGAEVKEGTVLKAGEHTLTAKTPTDHKNFKAAPEKTVKINVKQLD